MTTDAFQEYQRHIEHETLICLSNALRFASFLIICFLSFFPLVLNLDTNYVATDTNLVDRYKTLVRRLDWENENGKTYSRKIQETAQEISREILSLLTPLGLIFVSVSTWMVDGKVVSAMPFP